MKELFRKFSSIFLTLIMLGSTTSWTVEEHYCMGRLVDIAVFGDAHFCDMDESELYSESEADCCDDEIMFLDGQDQIKVNLNTAELPSQPFFVNSSLIWVDMFEDYPERKPICDIHPPPKLIREIQLLYEVYLI